MNKLTFPVFFVLFLVIINLSYSIDKEDFEKASEDYTNQYINEFRGKVKNYLTERKIYKNESAIISKELFRKIFREIMSGENEDNISPEFLETFDKLTETFIEDAFPEGVNYIKGSEIHNYFEYEKITEMMSKYAAKSSGNTDL